MARCPRLAPACVLDWVAITSLANEEIITSLRTSPAFMEAQSFRAQCWAACQILRVHHRPVVPYSIIGRILGTTKGTLKYHCRIYDARASATGLPGRPGLIAQTRLTELVRKIEEGYQSRRPWTMVEIMIFLQSQAKEPLDKNTVYHIIAREPRIKSCRGVPMEEKRLEVSPEQIAEYFERASQAIDAIPAHFVFNMDEMGHQEWADKKVRQCFVPSYHEADQVAYPVPRSGKRITLVACIAADGSHLKPVIVIPRKTIDEDLFLTGLTTEKVDVYSQSKGYIDRPIFDAWLEDTFLLELLRRRQLFNYDGRAVLILDNCTSHDTAKLAEISEVHGLLPLPLPPHSSNQLQALDLSIFGVTKRHLARVNRMEGLNVQSKHIAQVVCAFMAAAVPVNIVQTFRNAGIVLVVADNQLFCKVEPARARCLLQPNTDERVEGDVLTEEDREHLEAELYVQECAGIIEDSEAE
jgi:hypothetical protein